MGGVGGEVGLRKKKKKRRKSFFSKLRPRKKNFFLPLKSFLACSKGNGSGTGYLALSMCSKTFSIVPCVRIRLSADFGPIPRIVPA